MLGIIIIKPCLFMGDLKVHDEVMGNSKMIHKQVER